MQSAILIMIAFVVAIGILAQRMLSRERRDMERLHRSMRNMIDLELGSDQAPKQRPVVRRPMSIQLP